LTILSLSRLIPQVALGGICEQKTSREQKDRRTHRVRMVFVRAVAASRGTHRSSSETKGGLAVCPLLRMNRPMLYLRYPLRSHHPYRYVCVPQRRVLPLPQRTVARKVVPSRASSLFLRDSRASKSH